MLGAAAHWMRLDLLRALQSLFVKSGFCGARVRNQNFVFCMYDRAEDAVGIFACPAAHQDMDFGEAQPIGRAAFASARRDQVHFADDLGSQIVD